MNENGTDECIFSHDEWTIYKEKPKYSSLKSMLEIENCACFFIRAIVEKESMSFFHKEYIADPFDLKHRNVVRWIFYGRCYAVRRKIESWNNFLSITIEMCFLNPFNDWKLCIHISQTTMAITSMYNWTDFCRCHFVFLEFSLGKNETKRSFHKLRINHSLTLSMKSQISIQKNSFTSV